jgi:hypothetical protein
VGGQFGGEGEIDYRVLINVYFSIDFNFYPVKWWKNVCVYKTFDE